MGTSQRRAREREERRQTILAAARALFDERGFEAASMDAIAARAELAKGTLYLYFKSKEELLLVLLEEDLTQLRATAATMLDQISSARDALEVLLRAAVAFYRRRPMGFTPLLRTPGREMDTFLSERLADQRDAMLEVLAGLVGKGQAQGDFRPSYDPMAVARMLWANFIGTAMLFESGGVPDLEEQLNAVLAIVRDGLSTEP